MHMPNVNIIKYNTEAHGFKR